MSAQKKKFSYNPKFYSFGPPSHRSAESIPPLIDPADITFDDKPPTTAAK